MTIPLQGANSDALAAKASTGGVIYATVWGSVIGGAYQNLVPAGGTPVSIGGSTASFYAPSNEVIISLIELANTSGSNVTVTLYAQSGASLTQTGVLTIPAYGRAEYS